MGLLSNPNTKMTGGTPEVMLRQKFNLIDISHLVFDI